MSDDSSRNQESEEEKAEERTPELLREAFDVFSKASSQLEQSYNELKERADRLAKELAIANNELQKQLAEKERISSFLENILDSIPSGIIVIGEDNAVAMTNEVADKMFSGGRLRHGADYRDGIEDEVLQSFISECISDKERGSLRKECTLQSEAGDPTVLEVGYAPVRNPAGERIASLIVAQDISRLKELEDQMVRTNRLAAMGEMAAQLAHEIRNPLGSIEIFAGLLGRDLRGTENQKLADNIVVGVKSLNAVVTNMLTFTRSIIINPEPVAINELVSETIGFMEQVLAVENIALDTDLDEQTGTAECDPELIKQVLLNLTQNSIFAMEENEDGLLSISSRPLNREDGRTGVEVSISDNGCGIPENELKKIFDPFFSTRKGGTGLGLSVVSQIIEKHGGVIVPESKVGEGTSMRLWLPEMLV